MQPRDVNLRVVDILYFLHQRKGNVFVFSCDNTQDDFVFL